MSDLGQDLAVALRLVALVIDIACCLYGNLATARIVAEMSKPRTPEREVTGDDICVIRNAFGHNSVTSP